MDESTTSLHASPPVKILVVDDHPNTAITLARAIAHIGTQVEVLSATSGSQALERVKDGAIDILITDMIMPEMTGLELIEKMQNHPAGRPAFTFLITAYDVPGLKVSARRLKVKDVIIKPVHPERICQIILQTLAEMDQARPVSVESPDSKPFTILIADDQPDNLMLLSRYLAREGYDYVQARDGLETLEKVRTHLPDLILLDINMPHKDGFVVLQELRADPATEHIPVIILTAARLDPSEIQSGLNRGADDYVTKPFDRKELLARIHTRLRVKQAEDVIRRQNRELMLLPEIGRDLSARPNIEELATIILKRTGETLGAWFGHILILNPDDTYQKTHYFDSPSSSLICHSKYTLPPRLLKIANEARQGFIIDDTCSDPRWDFNESDAMRSVVVVPMFGRHQLLGILLLTNEHKNYFTLEHLLLLQAICSQASIAIENAHMYASITREQERLTAVLQGAADAILMFDPQHRLMLVNHAGQKLFTDYEVKIGKPLTRGAGYDSLLGLLHQAGLTNASFSGEICWPDHRVFAASLTSIKEGGCVVVLHDVSRFKHLEKVKNEFIATASHDLRNPITSIKGFGHLIKRAGPLNEMQEDFVCRISNAAENMGDLVESMLDLAKFDLEMPRARKSLDIAMLLTQVTDEFQPQAKGKSQSLTLEITETSSRVQGDAMQLSQAFRNLIGNAIKYTPEGGTVVVSMQSDVDGMKVTIQDTGYGIPAADLPFIFNRFYRVRNNGHDDIEGNGLGLAIVKSIIEHHDGHVSLESNPGKGTCFTVVLPLLAIEDCDAAEVSEPGELDLKPNATKIEKREKENGI
jgi:CheY-like chemotaxis protein/signal transduction histidine kinase